MLILPSSSGVQPPLHGEDSSSMPSQAKDAKGVGVLPGGQSAKVIKLNLWERFCLFIKNLFASLASIFSRKSDQISQMGEKKIDIIDKSKEDSNKSDKPLL